MGGSAKPPQESDDQKKAEDLQIQLMQAQLDQAKKPIETPKIPALKILPPPPPPTGGSQDVANAQDEAQRQAARRTNTGKATLFAGNTGGYGGANALGGQQSLLG